MTDFVQADTRYPGFTLQGESNAGSGKCGPAATDQRASPADAASAPSSHDLSLAAFINIAESNFSGARSR
jgi:hypothetical protein